MIEANSEDEGDDLVPNLDLEGIFMTQLDEPGHLPSSGEKSSPKHGQDFKYVFSGDNDVDPLSHNKLVIENVEQENDPELKDLGQRALTLQAEAEEVPVCFYKQNSVLMRKWRPPDTPASDEWHVVHQIVVPKVPREVISIAHDSPIAGHLGVRRTHDRTLNHF